MPEKFSNISRDEFERNQIEKGEVDYKFYSFKNLKIGNFDLGIFCDLFLESKNKNPNKFWSRDIYLKPEINILDLLNQNSGFGIEIGGPTIKGFNFFNIKLDSQNQINGFESVDLFKEYSKKNKVFISNILPGIFDLDSQDFKLKGMADFISQGSEMPLKDNQVSVVFMSNIGNISYNYLINLKNKGIYVPQKLIEEVKKIEEELKNKNNEEMIIYKKQKRIELIDSILKEIKRLLNDNGILIWKGIDEEENLVSALNLKFNIAQIEYCSYLEKSKKITKPDKAIFLNN